MKNDVFIFSINTLAGCKYSVLKELEKSFQIEKKFRKKFQLSKFISAITTTLSFIDDYRYRYLSRNMDISRPPIYVLGHWRSGTTYLNNLLCCFKNISYPTTYQTAFPNNLFFLQGIIKSIMQFYLPERRLIDGVKMHVDFPQEEEIGFGNEVFFSFYYWFYFPGDNLKISKDFLDFSMKNKNQVSKFKRDYLRFVKRCILNVGGEQYIAKNPPNMARIPVLLDLFPGARFVYIDRNPYEVLKSTFNFYKGFLITLQLQEIKDDDLWKFIYRTYIDLFNWYQLDKHLIPEGKLVEMKYEDLILDPVKIFRNLQQKIFSDLEIDEKLLNSSIKTSKNHSIKKYKFGRKYIDRVNKELGSLIEIQGYKAL